MAHFYVPNDFNAFSLGFDSCQLISRCEETKVFDDDDQCSHLLSPDTKSENAIGRSEVAYMMCLPCNRKEKHGASSHLFKGNPIFFCRKEATCATMV